MNEMSVLQAEPTWSIAKLFPDQGTWSEEEYLMLPGNRLVEYSQGFVQVLSMPSYPHHLVVAWLYQVLSTFVHQHRLGQVIFAPLRVRLWAGKYREPDLLFMARANRQRIHDLYWEGADLVMEVMSPDDPERDAETKRREYGEAGIAEYWLINPMAETITVFTLPKGRKVYAVHGVYDRSQRAESVLLPGFSVSVDECFGEKEPFDDDE